MPQMAPMNWLLLMFMTLSIVLMFNSMNYFLFLYNSQSKNTMNLKKMNWKW